MFILVGLYRSPTSEVHISFDRLSKLIEIVNKRCDQIILAGDLNIIVLVIRLRNTLKSQNLSGISY